jgi:hypothetical protein
MSINFRSENCFPNPPVMENLRYSPQNLTNFDAGTSLASTPPCYQHRGNPSDMLQELHSFKPLCCSVNQRELARKALIAVKNRKVEDIRNFAKQLADDVAVAVD